MLKTYNGGGDYTVTFTSSGRDLALTEEEIDELIEGFKEEIYEIAYDDGYYSGYANAKNLYFGEDE